MIEERAEKWRAEDAERAIGTQRLLKWRSEIHQRERGSSIGYRQFIHDRCRGEISQSADEEKILWEIEREDTNRIIVPDSLVNSEKNPYMIFRYEQLTRPDFKRLDDWTCRHCLQSVTHVRPGFAYKQKILPGSAAWAHVHYDCYQGLQERNNEKPAERYRNFFQQIIDELQDPVSTKETVRANIEPINEEPGGESVPVRVEPVQQEAVSQEEVNQEEVEQQEYDIEQKTGLDDETTKKNAQHQQEKLVNRNKDRLKVVLKSIGSVKDSISLMKGTPGKLKKQIKQWNSLTETEKEDPRRRERVKKLRERISEYNDLLVSVKNRIAELARVLDDIDKETPGLTAEAREELFGLAGVEKLTPIEEPLDT